MNHKLGMKFYILFSLITLLSACNSGSKLIDEDVVLSTKKADIKSSNPPNIIYIMADDMGYGDLGVYGQAKIKTPNIDQLSKEGMRFTQHYAGATVCGPSRASLLTGLHGGHSPIRGNPVWTNSGKPVDLKPEDVTIAEMLKANG